MAASLRAFAAPPTDADLPPAAGGTLDHTIPGFEKIVYRQETDHTCGPASMRMVLEKLGRDVPESELAKSALTLPWGTLHWTEASALNAAVRPLGLRADMVADAPDEYARIRDSIARDRPVVFLWGTDNDFAPGEKCLHYSVLVGIDEKAGTVTIANPFGYLEKVGLADWWRRFSLAPDTLPATGNAAVASGLLKPRTAFFVDGPS
jgi:hypothetical protein